MNPGNFFTELKRRNVYKVAVAYAVVAWLLIQIATATFPVLEIPNWATKLVIAVVVLGFPLALIFAWAFELTPEGIKRTENVAPGHSIAPRTGRKLMIGIATIAAVAAGLLLFQFLRNEPDWAAAKSAAPKAAERSGIPAKSIAVLPFQNLSKEEENAFFTNGVQDEILTTLAKVADLKVISRTSVMQFRDPEKRNLREIAQALNVAHVLEGSVQRSANRVRVTAQLIDARTDIHLWAERYDRDLADVFAIQSEIAEKIAQQLQARLSPAEKGAIEAKPTGNLVAYDFYLRASELERRVTDEGRASLMERLSLFEQAVAHDPQFVPALCMVARTHLELYWSNFDHTADRLAAANDAIRRAAAVQPHAAEVHLARAFERYWGYRDYAGATAELEKARRVLPNDADVLSTLGLVERRAGQWEQAIRHLEAAVALDPRNGATIRNLRDSYVSLRRYDEGARVLDQALQWAPHEFSFAWPRAAIDVARSADLRRIREVLASPAIHTTAPEQLLTELRLTLAFYERDYARARDILARFDGAKIAAFGSVTPRQWHEGRAALGLGDRTTAAAAFEAARDAAVKEVAARPDDAKALIILAQIDARLGRRDIAMEEAEQARALLPPEKDAFDSPQIDWLAAGVYAQVGKAEHALDILERSVQLPRGVSYGHLSLSDEWDPLRDHPRFDKLLKSLAPKEPK